MRKFFRYFPMAAVGFSILACNLNSSLLTANPTVDPAAISSQVTAIKNTEAAIEPTSASTLSGDTIDHTLGPDAKIDPCLLISAKDAEAILGEPVTPAKNMNGACVFSNAKDGLYTVTATAAQDKETSGILQGQAMLVMFTGKKPDDNFTNKIRSLSDALDFKGFFTEMVTASKGSPVMSAKMFSGGGNDLTYWAWITAPPRRQGGFVAIRGTTLVNINVVVAESQKEDAMLTTLNNLSGEIYKKLPEKFTLGLPASSQTSQGPAATPTTVQVQNTPIPVMPTPTEVPSVLSAPTLLSPANGSIFDLYPRNTTLTWAPVDRAATYNVEVIACPREDPAHYFTLPWIDEKSHGLTSTSFSFEFPGAQPGKWRVIPVDANGVKGMPSVWWNFEYLQ